MSTFLQLVEGLLRESGERALYEDDPSGYLDSHGFGDFDRADVELSLQLAADSFPPALAARIDPAQGLDTITSIDIDEVPGLWAAPDDSVDAMSINHGDDDESGEVDPLLDDPAELDGIDDASDFETADTNTENAELDDMNLDDVRFDESSIDEGTSDTSDPREPDSVLDGLDDTELLSEPGILDSPVFTTDEFSAPDFGGDTFAADDLDVLEGVSEPLPDDFVE